MKISIITVSFNSFLTIEDTIKSVLQQTYHDVEYIIVDGESRDGTIDIIKKYDSSINIWISEKDEGLYHAMNKGIQLASGEVVGILNSDDIYYDNEVLKNVMDEFLANPNLDSVFANLLFVLPNDTNKVARMWITGDKRKFSRGWHPAHPSFFVKRKCYEQYGLFDLDFKLAADFEIMLRFLETHRISSKYVNQFLVKMRLGGETTKSLKNIIKQNIECLNSFHKNNISVNRIFYPFLRVVPKLMHLNLGFFKFKNE